jgi:DNA-binding transcriptional ArsR family regulator
MIQKALRQFTIKRLREPVDKQLDEDIEWICNSLGFLSSRDQDKTAYRILKALIESAKDGIGMTSEELAQCVEPTIGSVHYHLIKLMKAGLVVKLGSVYELRMNSLRKTIEEIERDIRRTLVDIKRIAGDIDGQVGLEHRQSADRI